MATKGGSEFIISLLRHHPFASCFLLVIFTPPFYPLLVFFSPLLISTALFVAAIISVGPHLNFAGNEVEAERNPHSSSSYTPRPTPLPSLLKTVAGRSKQIPSPVSSVSLVACEKPNVVLPPSSSSTVLPSSSLSSSVEVLWPEWVQGMSESSRTWVANKMKEETMTWLPSSSSCFETILDGDQFVTNPTPKTIKEEDEAVFSANMPSRNLPILSSNSDHSRNIQTWSDWLKALDEESRTWIEQRLTEEGLWTKQPNQETILALVEREKLKMSTAGTSDPSEEVLENNPAFSRALVVDKPIVSSKKASASPQAVWKGQGKLKINSSEPPLEEVSENNSAFSRALVVDKSTRSSENAPASPIGDRKGKGKLKMSAIEEVLENSSVSSRALVVDKPVGSSKNVLASPIANWKGQCNSAAISVSSITTRNEIEEEKAADSEVEENGGGKEEQTKVSKSKKKGQCREPACITARDEIGDEEQSNQEGQGDSSAIFVDSFVAGNKQSEGEENSEVEEKNMFQSNRKLFLFPRRRSKPSSSSVSPSLVRTPLKSKNGEQMGTSKEEASQPKVPKLRWTSPNKESEVGDQKSSLNPFDDASDEDEDLTNPFSKSP